MANWKYPRKPTKETTHKRQGSQQQQVQKPETKPPPVPPPQQQPSWTVMRGIFSCRDLHTQQQQPEQKKDKENEKNQKKQRHEKHNQEENNSSSSKKCKKMRCSVSLCNNNTTKIVSAHSPNSNDLVNNGGPGGSGRERGRGGGGSNSGVVSNSSSSMVTTSSFSRGMPFTRFSGCYECRMVVDPVLGGFSKVPSSLRTPTIWSCPDCRHIFMNPHSLELHQSVTHAVSELGAEDTSKNIVEIIFQSSWLRKESSSGDGGSVTPVCKIDRILKVQNTQSRISKFEEYRDSIKAKATNFPKKHPRCIADGNELLRFHSATFRCSLGLNGSSNLCCSAANANVDFGGGGCNACSIIKDGFGERGEKKGILTTATSGRAPEEKVGPAAAAAEGAGEGKRAMLVCRVIAGRVMKKKSGVGVGVGVGSIDESLYDSVAGENVGLYSNLDELYVFNPMAILPCFVVIYGGF